MTVYETDIPGVGRKFELDVADGGRAVVLLHHDGRVEVFRRPTPEADSERVFELTSTQANRLGSIIEGAYFETVDLDNLAVPLGDAIIEWYEIDADAGVAGETLAEANLRTETGASILAIHRDGETIANPGGGTVLRPGDTLVALGTRRQQTTLADRLRL